MYKCYYNINLAYLNKLFERSPVCYSLRDPYRLVQPKFRTIRYGYNSFSYFGAKVWNNLPSHIKGINDLDSFKRTITQWCLTADLRCFDVQK